MLASHNEDHTGKKKDGTHESTGVDTVDEAARDGFLKVAQGQIYEEYAWHPKQHFMLGR
jgi:hypothetical protein